MPACCRAHLPSVPYPEISSHPGPFPELSLDRFYLPHHRLGDSCANHRSLCRCDLSHIHSLAPPVSGVQGWEYLGSKTIHFACLVAGSAPPAVTLQGREAPERRESLSKDPAVNGCPRGRCLSCLSSVSCSFPSQLLCSLSGSKRVLFLSRLTASGDLPFLTRPGTPGSMSGCLPHPLVTKLRNTLSRPALPCSRCCLSNSPAYLSNCLASTLQMSGAC